jgi:hypothetical protein
MKKRILQTFAQTKFRTLDNRDARLRKIIPHVSDNTYTLVFHDVACVDRQTIDEIRARLSEFGTAEIARLDGTSMRWHLTVKSSETTVTWSWYNAAVVVIGYLLLQWSTRNWPFK